MQPTLLLTRPQEEAQKTASFLEKKGFHVLFLPLFTSVERPFSATPPVTPFQAIIATSQRALQIFAARTSCRSTSLYTVGDRTAALARSLGFSQVSSAGGTALDLVRLIAKECVPDIGNILYISGAHTSHDLAALLARKGFTVHQEILYTMKPSVLHLPEPLACSFKRQEIAGTLLFSAQTALSFSRLMRQSGLGENCEIGYLFCLSQAVAQALSLLSRKIKIAKKPNQASLLEIVYETIPSHESPPS